MRSHVLVVYYLAQALKPVKLKCSPGEVDRAVWIDKHTLLSMFRSETDDKNDSSNSATKNIMTKNNNNKAKEKDVSTAKHNKNKNDNVQLKNTKPKQLTTIRGVEITGTDMLNSKSHEINIHLQDLQGIYRNAVGQGVCRGHHFALHQMVQMKRVNKL